MNGVLIIDKPAGLTSHDVVARVRRILHERSIGHLGTLDPMATGALPLVIGSFTRLAQFYASAEKVYQGTIRFGFTTDTYDAEGEPTSPPQDVTLRPQEIEALAANFRGLIEQVPPPFSAKKIKGVPAYKLARKHKQVVLEPVQVEIKELEIQGVEQARVRFRARVASGTYLRSVAHDMGQALGCGAHLECLRRTAVAEFTLADAHTLEEVAAAAGKSNGARGETSHVARAPSPACPGGTTESSSASTPSREAAPECSPRREPWEAETTAEQVPEGRKNHSALDADGAARPTALQSDSGPLAGEGARATWQSLESFFIHPRRLLPQMPSVTADEPTAARIRAGRTVNLPELSRARQVKVFAGQRDLLAIATRVAGTLFHPKIVFKY